MGLIERNARFPSSKNIAKFCEVFNVSYDYLVLGKDEVIESDLDILFGMKFNYDHTSGTYATGTLSALSDP